MGAERYYLSQHGVVATLEKYNDPSRHDLEEDFEFDELPRWVITFDLGKVSAEKEAAHRSRVEASRKRKLQEVLLEGPNRKEALGDFNVISRIISMMLGERVSFPVMRFLGVDDFMLRRAFGPAAKAH